MLCLYPYPHGEKKPRAAAIGISAKGNTFKKSVMTTTTRDEKAFLATALVSNAVELHIVTSGYGATVRTVQTLLQKYCGVPEEELVAQAVHDSEQARTPAASSSTVSAPTAALDALGACGVAHKSRWADLMDDEDADA